MNRDVVLFDFAGGSLKVFLADKAQNFGQIVYASECLGTKERIEFGALGLKFGNCGFHGPHPKMPAEVAPTAAVERQYTSILRRDWFQEWFRASIFTRVIRRWGSMLHTPRRAATNVTDKPNCLISNEFLVLRMPAPPGS
ncbi:MAG: hypothetical protein WBF06_01670 [Candidatus Acidiferrales bacterium]